MLPRLDSRTSRRMMLAVYALLLAAVAVAVLIAVLAWSTSRSSDRLAVVANFLAGGTLLLALLAGFVALQAYAAATGLPDLRLKVTFWGSHINEPTFAVREVYGELRVDPENQTAGTIFVGNSSPYSARNPAIIVRLHDMVLTDLTPRMQQYWSTIDWVVEGSTAFQWDGGPNFSIHGGSRRLLPQFEVDSALVSSADSMPRLTFELLADGYRRVVEVPVRLVPEPQRYESPEGGGTAEWL